MPSPPYSRPFTAVDADRAADIHKLCFADDPWPALAFSTLLQSGAEGFIAETDPGSAVGLILCRAAADEAEILTFAVIPAMRRSQIGYSLLNDTVDSLKKRMITRLFLEVARTNQAAIELYLKAGFIKVGERSGYYAKSGGLTDAHIMQKQINAPNPELLE